MKHPIETAAEHIRATAAEATETLNLGGAWPAGLPLETVILLALAVIGIISVTVVAGIPIVLVLMERKVSAYFQNRLGPTRVGPWGLLVTLADGIKLIFKEDMVPPSSDRKLFRLAPYVVFAASFAVVAVIPPFQSTVIGNMGLGAVSLLGDFVAHCTGHHHGGLGVQQQILAVRRAAGGGADCQLRNTARTRRLDDRHDDRHVKYAASGDGSGGRNPCLVYVPPPVSVHRRVHLLHLGRSRR